MSLTHTIVVAEDNPITRKMMRIALESEGYEVLEAGDGRTALDLVATRRPAMLLQDYVLPDMDGLRLLESVRALPTAADLPVLMITGMVSQIEELRARTTGPTSILPKPLEPSRLLEIVRTHLAGGPPSVGHGRKILVVDDEVLGLKLASLRLRDAGFVVVTAANGAEALQRAAEDRPDAILSDVLMPGMDGFELCQAVRGDPRLASTPIVLLSSAFVEDDDAKLAREMGANRLLARTPDLGDAIQALGHALRDGVPAPSTQEAGELAARHSERIQFQLEKQIARNEALLRQGAIQAAALSVVRGLALTLANPRDVPSILADVLVHCLDAAGLSTGLLYLAAPGGKMRLQAQAGLPASAREAAAQCFGHPEVLRQALETGDPIAYNFAAPSDAAAADMGAGLGRQSAMLLPFLAEGEAVGVLVLAADSQDLTEPAWKGFGRALAVQFGQTIALGRFIARGAASEARYRSLMEQANDAILLVGEQGIIEANRKAESLLGRERSEIVGRHYEEFVAVEERQQAAQGRAALLSEATTRTVDRHLIRADGSRVPVEVSGSLVTIGEESLAVLILRDVTERVQAELRLRESEKQYRLLFESNPHPMWVYDPATLAFLAVNQAAIRLYGYTRDEFLAMTIADLGPPEDVVPPWDGDAAAASGFSRHRRKGGAALDVDIVSSVIVFRGTPARLVLAMDMSDKKRLEAQLLQAQKMEAVGRLAGGVAHDFNNLLGVITGYSDLLSKNLEDGHPGRKRLEQIQRAAERATGLTRQLLAFSRKQVLEPKVLDLNDVVADVEKMLDRLIGEDVQLVTVFGPDLGKVRADRGQVEQVLLNLVVNARDAMPRGGRLLLETSNAVLDQTYARLHPEARPGPYVLLAVSDTGHGMDAQTQSHIFEPFFTTKEEGKGTGLGLATVFGIVTQSGGTVDVYSEIDWGTTFRIYLPRIDDYSAVPSRPASPSPAPAGTETILLVEDAEPLRVMIREILEGGGYTVIEATDPEQALANALAPGQDIHLLLTDVVMPRMSGPELAGRLRSGAGAAPKVLYMSGYTDEAIGHHGVLEPGTHFLQKPFTSEALLRKVRDALDAGVP